jgi:hypothetical protein
LPSAVFVFFGLGLERLLLLGGRMRLFDVAPRSFALFFAGHVASLPASGGAERKMNQSVARRRTGRSKNGCEERLRLVLAGYLRLGPELRGSSGPSDFLSTRTTSVFDEAGLAQARIGRRSKWLLHERS